MRNKDEWYSTISIYTNNEHVTQLYIPYNTLDTGKNRSEKFKKVDLNKNLSFPII